MKSLIADLKKLDLIDTSIQKNLPSKRFSTFGLGADIPYLIECNNSDDGVKILDFLHGRSKFYTLGNGSNIIFPDEELTYPLFKLGRGFNYHQIYNENEDQFSIGAATPIMSLSRALSDLSYSGLEFAAGIPAILKISAVTFSLISELSFTAAEKETSLNPNNL